jgi:hypothetical protein
MNADTPASPVGLLAAAFVVVRRRRRPAACAPPAETVAFVEAPTLKSEPAEAGAERAGGTRELACSRQRMGATLSVRVLATRKREIERRTREGQADWPLWRRARFRLGFNCC